MKSTLIRLSSGVLTAVLALAIPAHSTVAESNSPLETDSPQAHTVIEEWHWRDMSF
ncbi:MAG: hypothetical protein AAGA46_11315 [Cyanobacteria bacterium P01_F01_bin.13]